MQLGHRGDELGRLVRVAGVEDGAAVHGPHHREVLERHLGRAVLADRDAGVRAGRAPWSRPADRRHADEVVGAGEEGGEGRGERLPAPDLQADGGGDHLLLGDEHLEEPVGVGRLEDLRVGRVGDLAVERDDVGRRRRRAAASASP